MENTINNRIQKAVTFKCRGKDGERQNFNYPNKSKGIQYHEYEGFGHIQVECPNFLRKKRKSYIATFYDDESDEESKSNQLNNVMVFTTRVKESSNFELLNNDVFPDNNENVSDDDLSNDALVESYKTPYVKWIEESQIVEGRKERIEVHLQDKNHRMFIIDELKK